jgi:hypothetical protein
MTTSNKSTTFTDQLTQRLDEAFGDLDDISQASSSGTLTHEMPTQKSTIEQSYREGATKLSENPLQFSNVTLDPKLRPQGAGDLTFFQKLSLRMERGQLTKEQVIKTTQLIFNTEFQHLALQSSLKLSEANEAAIQEYLRRTTKMRKEMSNQIGKELVSVVDVYWKAVERAARARASWQATIKKLQSEGLYSAAEAATRVEQTTASMLKIEADCKSICDQIIGNVMDKVQHALSVRVNDLIGDENATASKLIPH